jgi:hypothetical protein
MLIYRPIPTEIAHAYQTGAPDDYGNAAEHMVSGGGDPCRHCLQYIPKGNDMLALAHRPFPAPQAYAETGPVFLCAVPCEAPKDPKTRPEVLSQTGNLILRGYGADNRIVYGTGVVVPCKEIEAHAKTILADASIAYVHVRSSTNNCFRLRIERA